LRSAARHARPRALRLPHCRGGSAGVLVVHREVAGAGARALEEHVVPPGTTVTRPENPALAMRAPRVSGRGDVHHAGIARVHADAPDVTRVTEPHVRPGGAAVGGPGDGVAGVPVAAD